MESTNLLFTLTHVFKDAIGEAAQAQGISSSELIRRAVATAIGYDLDGEKKKKVERRGRPRLYATSAEREAVIKERAIARKELTNMLLEHVRSQEHGKSIEALQRSIERKTKGINIR